MIAVYLSDQNPAAQAQSSSVANRKAIHLLSVQQLMQICDQRRTCCSSAGPPPCSACQCPLLELSAPALQLPFILEAGRSEILHVAVEKIESSASGDEANSMSTGLRLFRVNFRDEHSAYHCQATKQERRLIVRRLGG